MKETFKQGNMISVLIPIYNYNVLEVTKELHNQLSAETTYFEILLLDDGSEEQYKILIETGK